MSLSRLLCARRQKQEKYVPRVGAPPFVPPVCGVARLHPIHNLALTEEICIKELIYHVELARFTIDIYLMALHRPAILTSLIHLCNEENVKIRVILDKAFKKELNESAQLLLSAGISVRWKPVDMTYKYKVCLIDCRAGLDKPIYDTVPLTLMTDSINNIGFVDNTEHAIVITSKMTLMQYQRQFDIFWEKLAEYQ